LGSIHFLADKFPPRSHACIRRSWRFYIPSATPPSSCFLLPTSCFSSSRFLSSCFPPPLTFFPRPTSCFRSFSLCFPASCLPFYRFLFSFFRQLLVFPLPAFYFLFFFLPLTLLLIFILPFYLKYYASSQFNPSQLPQSIGHVVLVFCFERVALFT
jgi:hypothetical protein